MRVFLAHGTDSTRRILSTTLEVLGHDVVGQTHSGCELAERCIADPPDIIISGVSLANCSAIDALLRIAEHEPLPAILVALRDDVGTVERAMDDHVMAYLVEPVNQDDLRPLMLLVKRRFDQFQSLRQENRDLKRALAIRKKIERAKGILMSQNGIDEEAAFRKLQRMATDARCRIEAVAEDILEAKNRH